jgi:hypothetical protein
LGYTTLLPATLFEVLELGGRGRLLLDQALQLGPSKPEAVRNDAGIDVADLMLDKLSHLLRG